jgi:alanyl-tRNA synthetase
VDVPAFEAEMEKQRQRARAAAKGGAEAVAAEQAYAALRDVRTEFVGYEALDAQTKVVGLLRVGAQGLAPLQSVEAAETGAQVEILLAETPFYPEGGGQVGDRGEIIGPDGRVAVEDTQRVAERLIVHRGRVVEGRIAAGDTVTARVDPQHRADTMRNHTGTHLLHAALRRVLGSHVRQAGSLVAPDHLRFDFTHTEPLTPEHIAEVQRLVNEKVREDLPVDTRETTYDRAMAEGVLAFFGEKYGEEVRVVEVNSVVPRFSAELCGGTHCHRTGEIGMLIVTGESSIGAGMRRIEALTGRGAEEHVRAQLAALEEVARRLGAPRDAVPAKLEALLAEADARRKTVERLERALAAGPGAAAGKRETHSIDGVSVSTVEVEVTSEQALRFMGDALKKEIAGQAAAAVIGALVDDRPSFLAVASAEAAARGLRADALVREIARLAGGGGGGRADLATGGGKDRAKLAEALKQVPDIARKLLAGKQDAEPGR